MYKSKNILYPIIALLTVVIWDTIFVSTKVLINEGLSPVEILLYHFILAYSCIWIILHGKLWANCPKDELLLFLAGLCGGSLYFIAENTVLGITPASNVYPEHCNTTERIRIIWKNTIVQTIWHILLCHKKQSLYLLTKQASNLDIRSLVDVETFEGISNFQYKLNLKTLYKDYIKAIEYYLNHDEFLNK